MSEMVERVALAMQAALEGAPGDFDGERPHSPYPKLARAAIKAMREPTRGMLKATDSIMGGGFQNSHSDQETWEAMIEAALEDK